MLLETLGTFRQPLLIAGQSPPRIVASRTGGRSASFAGETALRIGELTCFELHVAERAAPVVGPRTLHLAFELTQSIRCAIAAI